MVMVQIRNVPDDLHRRLKARAAMAGKSLSEYALGELRKSLEKPPRAEVLERIRGRGLVETDESSVEAVDASRHERDDVRWERTRR